MSYKTECYSKITELFQKYENSEYMSQRIYNHIINYLPNTLENEYKNFEQRQNRNTFLTKEQQIFIQVFLSKNKYYYLHNNNFFYEYNGKNYFIVREDDIIHKLLSTISKEQVLLQWKYKTKMNVIKQIKERSLFNCIPETDTIQNILNVLYPSIFDTKNTAKYFLTIIGDNILKKNTNLIFLVTPQMKKLLFELDNMAFSSIGYSNITFNFMTKYHENHSYDIYRLIKMNDNFTNDVWRDILKKIALDLLCVATHYSKRYENSDNFIENKSYEELKIYTYYLKNTTPNRIVIDFSNKYIIESSSSNDIKIEWKNLHFLWKQYLSINNLPNVIYSNTLKNIFKQFYTFDESSDSFIGITSKYLPVHIDFVKFWETTITIHTTDSCDTMFDNEIEIDELCSLFKYWTKQTNEHLLSNCNISEDNVLKIMKHFFPGIEIVEDKYVLNVSCSLWDKMEDIHNSFPFIKDKIKELMLKDEKLSLISFDDVYGYYHKKCKLNEHKFIVSKRYFEKYLYLKLSTFILYEKFIDAKWCMEN
jgi:hypothetical protein